MPLLNRLAPFLRCKAPNSTLLDKAAQNTALNREPIHTPGQGSRALPVRPEVTREVQVQLVSRESINAAFDEQFASATGLAEGHNVTMTFPASPEFDCVMSFPLDLRHAKALAQQLYGVVVQFYGEALLTADNMVITCDRASGIDIRRQDGVPIAEVLGNKLFEYTKKSRTTVSISISANNCNLTIWLELEDAVAVLQDLRSK